MNRKSVYYTPGNSRNTDSFYLSLFKRNNSVGTFPIRDKPKLVFDRRQIKLASSISNLFSTNGYDEIIDESVIDFITQSISFIASYGKIYVEIVTIDPAKGTSVNNVELEHIHPKTIHSLYFFFFQIHKDSQTKKVRFILLPRSKVWTISLPKRISSLSQYRRLLKRLDRLDEPMPSFARNDIGNNINSFDHQEYRELISKTVEQATKNWGGIRSVGQVDGTTEYYYLRNSLVQKRTTAILREHMISEMNKLLKRLGTDFEIKFDSLQTATEVDLLIAELRKGTSGFSKIT